MLVELGLVEQRYKAVLEVLNDGANVTDVARRYGVGRQTVHTWLRRYTAEGLGGLADHSPRPDTCPHQMPAPRRGPGPRDAPAAPGLGTTDHLEPADPRGSRTGARPHVDLSRPRSPSADLPEPSQAQGERLQALGALPCDGVLADGHHLGRLSR